MSVGFEFGELQQIIPGHPLRPGGHEFADDDHVLVTEWGDVLPSVEFSAESLVLLKRIADDPNLFDEPCVTTLAQYLAPKLSLDGQYGCWQLPLHTRTKGHRLYYPQVNIASLGFRGYQAHRASMSILMGVELPAGARLERQVDHRCRNQTCCNPYHLEVVDLVENNRRKNLALNRAKQGDLFQLSVHAPGRVTFGGLYALIEAVNGRQA